MGLWRAHQPETSGLSSGCLAPQEGPGVYPGLISVPGTHWESVHQGIPSGHFVQFGLEANAMAHGNR